MEDLGCINRKSYFMYVIGCYSIEETTFIQFYETTGNLLQGEIYQIDNILNLLRYYINQLGIIQR